jgi:hypothetical protein
MKTLADSWLLYATICSVIVLALVMGAVAHGTPRPVLVSHGEAGDPDCDGSCIASSAPIVVSHGEAGDPDCDGSCIASNAPIVVSHGEAGDPDCDGSCIVGVLA